MGMKHKQFGAYQWTSILEKRYKQKCIQSKEFNGVVGLLYIDESTDFFRWDIFDQNIEVCKTGMKWLQLMGEEQKCVITAMISPENRINLFYIDMIAQGMIQDGVAWFDDLYLDLIVHPDGLFYVDDRDELDEAYEDGVITKQQYEMALSTCDELKQKIGENLEDFLSFIYRKLEEMEAYNEFTPLQQM